MVQKRKNRQKLVFSSIYILLTSRIFNLIFYLYSDIKISSNTMYFPETPKQFSLLAQKLQFGTCDGVYIMCCCLRAREGQCFAKEKPVITITKCRSSHQTLSVICKCYVKHIYEIDRFSQTTPRYIVLVRQP